MKIALFQMCAGINPAKNASALVDAIKAAKVGGATMLFTPEMSGLLDRDRARAQPHILPEVGHPVLASVQSAAREAGMWVHLGSLALAGEGRNLNRGFVVSPDGQIFARYDKLHLFDVDLPTGESWRESAAYSPGADSVVAKTPVGKLGLSICYDLRFPALYQALSAAGAEILAVPAAFTVPTGEAHWHVLLRARAIENACWVVAAAQCGTHEDGRETYGHSLVVDPWGRVVLDMEQQIGLGFADIDPNILADVRTRVPVLDHRRSIPIVRVVS
ncbi:MAG: carbon-nitrogen hydrolase family protein [Alphaproteobacteria bacterium]|jgi:predicted amidohydrolase|nr:carbon-nitrogen hydrolase family protein [Alphaproteobacteria bacterium]